MLAVRSDHVSARTDEQQTRNRSLSPSIVGGGACACSCRHSYHWPLRWTRWIMYFVHILYLHVIWGIRLLVKECNQAHDLYHHPLNLGVRAAAEMSSLIISNCDVHRLAPFRSFCDSNAVYLLKPLQLSYFCSESWFSYSSYTSVLQTEDRISGVTTAGQERQLPPGAKLQQGAPWSTEN